MQRCSNLFKVIDKVHFSTPAIKCRSVLFWVFLFPAMRYLTVRSFPSRRCSNFSPFLFPYTVCTTLVRMSIDTSPLNASFSTLGLLFSQKQLQCYAPNVRTSCEKCNYISAKLYFWWEIATHPHMKMCL